MKYNGFRLHQFDSKTVAGPNEMDWQVFPIMTRIGAPALMQSNFNYIEGGLRIIDPEQKYYSVVRHRHWTYSWYEYIIYDPKSNNVSDFLSSIKIEMEDNPCLDDEGFILLQAEYGELDEDTDDLCPDPEEETGYNTTLKEEKNMEKYGIDKSSEMEKTAKKKEETRGEDLIKQTWDKVKKREIKGGTKDKK